MYYIALLLTVAKKRVCAPVAHKINLATLSKCKSRIQYYKIDLSFSIKLQEINLNVCNECV